MNYYEPKDRQDKLALAAKVEEFTLQGLSDQAISTRLHIDPAKVSFWREYAERNLARRKPQMTAEAVEEELTRVNFFLAKLHSYLQDAEEDPDAPPVNIHQYIASFEKLSNRREKLLVLKATAVSGGDKSSTGATEEDVEREYQELYAKLKGNK